MKLFKNESGFSPVEVILLVGIIVSLGAVGWLVYDRQQSESDSTVVNNSSQQDKPHGGDESGLGDARSAAGYMTIKEWGVKLPLTEAVKDATYFAHTDADGSRHIYLSLASLAGTDCAASDGGGVAAYSRFKADKVAEPYVITEATPKIGEYYYFAEGSKSQCSDDEAVLNQANGAMQYFFDNVSDLRPL